MGGGGGYTPEEQKSKLALAEQAANALSRYGEVFVPLENMAIQDSLNRFGDQAYVDPMGRAATNTAAIYEPKQQEQSQAAFARGLDPSSGAYQTESQALSDAKGRAVGLSSAGAGLNNTDQAYQGIANMVRVGQGLQTDSMEGNISLAQSEIDRAGSAAERDFNASSSLRNIAGTAAGMGSSYGLRGGG
jgi:hypothetical protein